MTKPKSKSKASPIPCPRCGYPKAKPAGGGRIHCKQCGGLVEASDRDGNQSFSDDPERSLLAQERGEHLTGRVLKRSGAELRGGLN